MLKTLQILCSRVPESSEIGKKMYSSKDFCKFVVDM